MRNLSHTHMQTGSLTHHLALSFCLSVQGMEAVPATIRLAVTVAGAAHSLLQEQVGPLMSHDVREEAALHNMVKQFDLWIDQAAQLTIAQVCSVSSSSLFRFAVLVLFSLARCFVCLLCVVHWSSLVLGLVRRVLSCVRPVLPSRCLVLALCAAAAALACGACVLCLCTLRFHRTEAPTRSLHPCAHAPLTTRAFLVPHSRFRVRSR